MSGTVVLLGDVLLEIQAGKSVKTKERPAKPGELGILKVSAVTWGEFDPRENKAVLDEYDPVTCPRPMAGDLLISRANTRELVGAPVLVEENHCSRAGWLMGMGAGSAMGIAEMTSGLASSVMPIIDLTGVFAAT